MTVNSPSPISSAQIPGTPYAGSGSAVHVAGVERGSPDSYLQGAITDTIENSGMLSAVKPDDNVLILPATNSPDPYPATVHPLAVRTLVDQLEERGAKVVTGCTSGIEFTLPTPDGRVLKGSSLKCAEDSGLLQSGIEFTACEGLGWDKGYFKFTDERAGHWPDGFFVSNLVKEADHVFVASRISTHGMGGITLGLKNLMGYVRMDSRVKLHDAGVMPWFIHANAHGSGIKGRPSAQKDFFEKIAELGLAVQDKLRGHLLVGTKVQTTMGPNAHLLEFPFGRQRKWFKLFKSYVHEPETGLVIASKDIVASDAVASAFLADAYMHHTPLWNKFWQWVLRRSNKGQINPLGAFGVYEDPVIAQALAIGLGNRVGSLETSGVPHRLRAIIETAVLP